MKLENQVVNQEISDELFKRLSKVNIKLDTLFSRPTLTEMLAILPIHINVDGKLNWWKLENTNIHYERLGKVVKGTMMPIGLNNNPDTAAALLWIWLYDNGYIKL